MGFSLEEKIAHAKLECSGLFDGYDNEHMFNYLYPFTTENIAGYIDKIDFNDKRLLTVGSSGDQIINAILNGCQNITLIDLCPYAKEYFYLKRAALEVFNREEFLKYFCYREYKYSFNNINALDKKQYLKLREVIANLEPTVLTFWDALFKRYSSIRIRRRIFNYDEISVKRIKEINPYLSSDEAYNKVKEAIKKANINFNIENIFNHDFNNTYDIINLSNIWDYHKVDEISILINKMINYLNKEGTILIAYLYLVDKTKICIDNPGYQEKVTSLLNILPKDVTLSSFKTISRHDPDKRDTIITYKKVKKI